MSWNKRITLALKAIRELGVSRVGWYALYRLQLGSGYLRLRTPDHSQRTALSNKNHRIAPVVTLPDRQQLINLLGEQGCTDAQDEADEIVAGWVSMFGGDPVPLDLGNLEPKQHWTALERAGYAGGEQDIKWTWEPGRFGWAIRLGRAYWLKADERYAASFWKYLEAFQQASPPYRGPHWLSAQEVAIRLMALTFCGQVFAGSPHTSPERMAALGRMIADHAGRIVPGMAYARAQNNNHLLSEAAGLYTAGTALPEHPYAAQWRNVGWETFHRGIREQVSPDGTYVQHSTNYHRLLLQLACWVAAVARGRGDAFPEASHNRLEAATCWLLNLLDWESGDVPNLGPNDGAYIFPLAGGGLRDYRPAIQAASRAFLEGSALPPGDWDEMGLWLGIKDTQRQAAECSDRVADSSIRLERSWASLRAARFSSRPGHGDQLHVDLWWRGINLALDPGSYLYNAPPPWDNVLRHTRFHNTVTVNGMDQMTPAGRFLWLDWAQAGPVHEEHDPEWAWERLAAGHNGYRKLGLTHRRSLTGFQGDAGQRWVVEDTLATEPGAAQRDIRTTNQVYFIRLHWLMPDYPWTMEETGKELALDTPHGLAKLTIGCQGEAGQESPKFSLARAGEALFGDEPVEPARGWHAPGYGYKLPALSLSALLESTLPAVLVSEWTLTEKSRG